MSNFGLNGMTIFAQNLYVAKEKLTYEVLPRPRQWKIDFLAIRVIAATLPDS